MCDHVSAFYSTFTIVEPLLLSISTPDHIKHCSGHYHQPLLSVITMAQLPTSLTYITVRMIVRNCHNHLESLSFIAIDHCYDQLISPIIHFIIPDPGLALSITQGFSSNELFIELPETIPGSLLRRGALMISSHLRIVTWRQGCFRGLRSHFVWPSCKKDQGSTAECC